MRTGEIKALTGLRIFAALWVVLFHFRFMLRDAAPAVTEALSPVLNYGAQGVDLFFILSGFVLAWNYLDRMGPTWSARATLHFLWLRLARVWPVYLVTMHLAALWVIFTLNVGHVPSEEVHRLTAINYLRQILLVQLWFQPFFDDSSWDGPAWSISAEWLAYLLFGVLALVIFRMTLVSRTRSLLVMAFIISLTPVLFLAANGQLYTPWSWLPRIITEFTAGALAGAAVRRLQPSEKTRRRAGYLSVAVAAGIVGLLYLFAAYPLRSIREPGGLVDVLFVPLIVALAIGAGSLPSLLSTRLLVYCGQISFGLYMVHEIVHLAWVWAAMQFGWTLSGWLGKLVVLGLLAIAVGAAMLLFHVVEEPARHWMRGMLVRADPKSDARDEHPGVPVTTTLLPVDEGAEDDRPEGRAVRAV